MNGKNYRLSPGSYRFCRLRRKRLDRFRNHVEVGRFFRLFVRRIASDVPERTAPIFGISYRPRNDEFPTGGHGVVARVFDIVAQVDQAGATIVVGVLRESSRPVSCAACSGSRAGSIL